MTSTLWTNASVSSFTSLSKTEKACIVTSVTRSFGEFGVAQPELTPSLKAAYEVCLGKQDQSTLDALGLDVLDALEQATQILVKEKDPAGSEGRYQNSLKTSVLEELKKPIVTETKALLQKKQILQGYQDYRHNITVLNGFLGMGEKAVLVGVMAATGMSMYYARSHKLLALASGCSAFALFILRSTCLKLQDAFQQHSRTIEGLTLENLGEFSNRINGVYTELKKTRKLMDWYLSAQQNKTTQEHWGLQLLKEQLAAAKYLKDLKNRLISTTELFITEGSPSQNLSISSFFEKFEALCRSSKRLAIGISALELAWIYYAYVQRAYLMAIAGAVHLVVQAFVIKELNILQRGSGKIKIAQQVEQPSEANTTKVKEEFQSMAKHSFLFSLMGLQQASVEQIQSAVVIPFDAILKLIPAWKPA